ncbi:MAG: 3-phosphoshikimate 1-carboxyvinyltransferase [Betaproteobacteria bacterium]|nr:3-phosphoshikimate 1-carboxyvinyltransferase [Betaproteobacteria bacterium]
MALAESLDLAPVRCAAGSVRMPGSKSISNRVLLLAGLARGETTVRDLLDADDTGHMLAALRALGVPWRPIGSNDYLVGGAGGAFPVKSAELFLGNAGTAFRPLTAVLAMCKGEYRLSGTPRMHERPIADLVDALVAIGADIEYLGHPGFPPLCIHPGGIHARIETRVRGDVSSQFVTALLMALPLAGGGRISVDGELVSKPYVDMTLNMMARFGIEASRNDWSGFDVPPGNYRAPGEIHVEGDASSASYFLAAGAIAGLSGGGPVRVEGVGQASIQGDIRFVEILKQMGATVRMGANWIEAIGPSSPRLRAIDADLNHIPDAAMTVAILALFADGPSLLRNIGNWRVKETDRLAAMAIELRKVGAVVEEGSNYLRIEPPKEFCAASIDTYDDHRMAMCFSLVAMAGVAIRIHDPGCVRKTFPAYFEHLANISRN